MFVQITKSSNITIFDITKAPNVCDILQSWKPRKYSLRGSGLKELVRI
jgi:hypothetical protein